MKNKKTRTANKNNEHAQTKGMKYKRIEGFSKLACLFFFLLSRLLRSVFVEESNFDIKKIEETSSKFFLFDEDTHTMSAIWLI